MSDLADSAAKWNKVIHQLVLISAWFFGFPPNKSFFQWKERAEGLEKTNSWYLRSEN